MMLKPLLPFVAIVCLFSFVICVSTDYALCSKRNFDGSPIDEDNTLCIVGLSICYQTLLMGLLLRRVNAAFGSGISVEQVLMLAHHVVKISKVS